MLHILHLKQNTFVNEKIELYYRKGNQNIKKTGG